MLQILLHFNSQPHKEADNVLTLLALPCVNFNSQPHKEADSSCSISSARSKPFQLTASQGGWRYGVHYIGRITIFQLTASQGGWQYVLTSSFTLPLFQLTASQGGWQHNITIMSIIILFQLTASQGGWLRLCRSLQHQLYFNSQPHKEADSNFIQ